MTPISKSKWTKEVEEEPSILTHSTVVLVDEGRQCPRFRWRSQHYHTRRPVSRRAFMHTKQVIVMRRDLKMRRGKEIAQGSHASMAFLTRPIQSGARMERITLSKPAREWIESGFTKVCVRVDSEEDLLAVYQKAKKAGLEAHLVTDSGKTEFDGVPTKTCCAIGPDYSDQIDKITGHLELY